MHAVASRFARSACLVAAASLAVACHGSDKQEPFTPTPTVRSLAIVGVAPLERPGATAQLNAIATYSDGSTKNATFEAKWSAQPLPPAMVPAVSVATGLVTARQFGAGSVTAALDNATVTVNFRVAPPGAFLVNGAVVANGTGVPQARVEAASAAGTFSTLTGDAGAYVLPASGDTTWRAELGGFDPQVRQTTVARDDYLLLNLTPPVGVSDILGDYTLTLAASPSCALPPVAATRTYRARIVEGRTLGLTSDIVVELLDASLIGWGNYAGFVGTRAGATVLFAITDDIDMDVALLEALPDGSVLAVSGQGTATLAPALGSATFNGRLLVSRPGSGTPTQCTAPDHRLQFSR